MGDHGRPRETTGDHGRRHGRPREATGATGDHGRPGANSKETAKTIRETKGRETTGDHGRRRGPRETTGDQEPTVKKQQKQYGRPRETTGGEATGATGSGGAHALTRS